jgi:thioredoxin
MGEKMRKILKLTDDNIDGILSSNKMVVVDCNAEWCAPCKLFGPVFEAAAPHFPTVQFVTMDTDDNNMVNSGRFNIRSIPMVLFIMNGEIVNTGIGLMNKEQFTKFITDSW